MTGGRKWKMKNEKWKILHFKGGFTLMEMLVALALFSVVVTIGTDLFLTFQRTSRRTEGIEQVVSQARFVVERVVREARSGTIDYSAYTDSRPAVSEQALRLRTSADTPIILSFEEDTELCNSSPTPCIVLTIGSSSEPLTGGSIRARNLRFFITPLDNPFEFVTDISDPRVGQFRADVQPRVTVFLSLDNNLSENHQDYTRYDAQTTVSNRSYQR